MGVFMMKDISLRPKEQLMNLFEAVQKMENLPGTNRNAIIERALDMALKSNYVNWKAVSEVGVEHRFNAHVPNHVVLKVDDQKFTTINEQIKTAFKVEKITIPYTLKLLLTLYFIHLKQQTDNASQNEHLSELLNPTSEVNVLVLKHEYDHSIYSGKRRLLDACKMFLRNNIETHTKLVTQSQAAMQVYHDFIDLNQYTTPKATKTTPNLTFLAKILAGLLILRIESIYETNESKTVLDQILKQLELEYPAVGTAVDTNTDSADYYKTIYAKMMGGKI